MSRQPITEHHKEPQTKGGKALKALQGVLADVIREQNIPYPDEVQPQSALQEEQGRLYYFETFSIETLSDEEKELLLQRLAELVREERKTPLGRKRLERVFGKQMG